MEVNWFEFLLGSLLKSIFLCRNRTFWFALIDFDGLVFRFGFCMCSWFFRRNYFVSFKLQKGWFDSVKLYSTIAWPLCLTFISKLLTLEGASLTRNDRKAAYLWIFPLRLILPANEERATADRVGKLWSLQSILAFTFVFWLHFGHLI